jgi:hypothetical protein
MKGSNKLDHFPSLSNNYQQELPLDQCDQKID